MGTINCLECGRPATAKRRHKQFCGPGCRKAWNNRRMVRGAELYDLFMEMRFNRASAEERHVWSHICNLARAYRDSDKANRAGRLSWDSDADKRLPLAYLAKGDNR